jgi:BON domain
MTMLKRLSGFFIVALMVSALGCASTSQQASTGEYLDDSVETNKNVVQLSGSVDSTASMNKALALARSVEGVSSVKNDMRVK